MKIHSKHFSSSGPSLLSQMLWTSPKSSQEPTKPRQRYIWSEAVKPTESRNASRTGLVSYGTVPYSERAVFCQETRKLAGSGRVDTCRLVKSTHSILRMIGLSLSDRFIRTATSCCYTYLSFLAGPLEVSGQHSRFRNVFSQSQETSQGYHFKVTEKFQAERICRGFRERDPGVQSYTLKQQCKRQFSHD